MAQVTIRVEQDNKSNVEMKGNEKGAVVVSKEPYTGSGELLAAIANCIARLAELSS